MNDGAFETFKDFKTLKEESKFIFTNSVLLRYSLVGEIVVWGEEPIVE
jgi:hypothetical protein